MLGALRTDAAGARETGTARYDSRGAATRWTSTLLDSLRGSEKRGRAEFAARTGISRRGALAEDWVLQACRSGRGMPETRSRAQAEDSLRVCTRSRGCAGGRSAGGGTCWRSVVGAG